jgi:nitrogen fixation protein FixH
VKRGSGWPLAVGVILGAGVAANAWVIHLARSDPSFAVEEDYYQRALRWDDELAQRRHNRELGWRLQPTLSPITADSGARLSVTLHDAAGRPIDGARVSVRAMHNARAGQPIDAELAGDGAGAYALRLDVRRPGLWELRFDVRHGSERFTAGERVDVHAVPR